MNADERILMDEALNLLNENGFYASAQMIEGLVQRAERAEREKALLHDSLDEERRRFDELSEDRDHCDKFLAKVQATLTHGPGYTWAGPTSLDEVALAARRVVDTGVELKKAYEQAQRNLIHASFHDKIEAFVEALAEFERVAK